MKVKSVFFLTQGKIKVFDMNDKPMPEFEQDYRLQGRELMTRIFEDRPKVFVEWMQPIEKPKED